MNNAAVDTGVQILSAFAFTFPGKLRAEQNLCLDFLSLDWVDLSLFKKKKERKENAAIGLVFD